MAKGSKIRVRKTPCGLHLYTARIAGFGTYGWGDTPAQARECLTRRLKETGEGQTITEDTWPRRADGSRKKIGEMTGAQRVAVARGAVARLAPEFARDGVQLEFAEGGKDA